MAPPKPGTTIVIVKKKSGGGHAGHHGGAWKVAYADFVTAMMAFFLLLWLLNVTTQDQKKAIANYFDPTSASDSTSGSGGVMGGTSMLSPGAEISDTRPIGETIPTPGDPAAASDAKSASANAQDGQGNAGDKEKNAVAQIEDRNFKQAEAAIKQAIQSVPELQALAQNLLVDETPEGLRIQIVDQDGSSMFPSGGSEMFDKTKKLLVTVAQAVQKMPNQITVRGHTDSTPYHSSKGYSNWDLSSDRANATRRALVEAGLDPSRIASVVGKADKEPLFPENSDAPENRRISIILMRAAAANAQNDTAVAPMAAPVK